MSSMLTRTLNAFAFVLATLAATSLLVAAGLAEDQPSPAAGACITCPAGTTK